MSRGSCPRMIFVGAVASRIFRSAGISRLPTTTGPGHRRKQRDVTDSQLRIVGQNGSRTHDDRAHPRRKAWA